MLEQVQKMVTELVGLDGGDANAEVTVDFQNVFNQLLEISVLKLVTSNIDASQHDFLETMAHDFVHVIIYVLSGTTRRPSAHHRDGCVGFAGWLDGISGHLYW